MQTNGRNDKISQQHHDDQDNYEEEYDYENYVVMSRKWSRPPPPKRRTWWKMRNNPYYYDYNDEEEEQYDESLVDRYENNFNSNAAIPQPKDKTPIKFWRRKVNHDGNYDESLLLQEDSSIDEEFDCNVLPTSPVNNQQYKAPNVEREYIEQFIINNNNGDIESLINPDINDETYEKHKIERKNPKNENQKINPTRIRPRVSWHNSTEQNIQSTSPTFKSQPNTIRRSVFFSQSANGRIQFRLPSDKIHFVMDDTLEPGTLLLLHPIDTASHRLPLLVTSPSADIMDIFHSMEYVFTVDEDLYKRIVKEISDSKLIPCGFYYCCHEAGDKKVNIWVAVVILFLVFSFFLAVTLTWPTE